MDTADSSASSARVVRIPEEVALRLERRLSRTSFPTLDEFVTYVLARVSDSPSDPPFSEAEERRLKEKLRSLGYID